MIENGLCGRTTCHESKREPFVNGYPEARVCAEVNAPLSIAVVMLGTNDCKDEYGSDPARIAKDVKAVAKVFWERGAKILILSPAPIRGLEKSPFRDEFGLGAEEKKQAPSPLSAEDGGRNGLAVPGGGKSGEVGRL